MVEYPVQKERIKAIGYIRDNIYRFDDIKAAWEDLHRLTQDKSKEVIGEASFAMGIVFANVPDKDEAWEDLHLLTQDEDEYY